MTTYPAPICLGCVRFRAKSPGLTCSAFSDGIPVAILQSRVDQRYPYADDEGQYAWKDADAQAYADQRFRALGEDVVDFLGTPGRALFAKMVQVGLDGGDAENVA